MAYVVAITGGIGSGKTTVANLFAEHGIDLVDADVIAREVVEPGSPGLGEIQERFGDGILLPSGQLDRAKLREHIFNHPEDKAWLNGLLHPMIREEMLRQCQEATSPYCLLIVPLLVENKLQNMADRVLVVDVSESTQVARTVSRDNVSEAQVKNILSAQATREERLAVADDIIENDHYPEQLHNKVADLHRIYLTLAASGQAK
ncbi:dephospho-CoA kinase [Parasalinivibrio latis]|uniref:dephospho-CoA kinase n=1 Tax=Parasalinivibrio latis TaxID=2952610 RepID=UPI0030E4BDEA